MNILTIHHLCYYLEEIGIIDQASVKAFLSLYTFALNKSKKTNLNTPNIYENVLCAYLKKIFSVEKNFLIFSNKIISKFKQYFMIKQYNGLTLLFSLLSKKYNSFKIQSLFKIINKKQVVNVINNKNLYTHNNTYSNTHLNSPNNYIKFTDEKKTLFDSYRIRHFKKNRDEKEEAKSEIFNKSLDYIKIKRIKSNNNTTIDSTNSKNNNNINGNNKNIQLEYKKKQFLSKIKREHMVKFKKSNSVKKLKNNNSYKNFESLLLNNVSPKCINYNDEMNKENNLNNKKIKTTPTEYSYENYDINDINNYKTNREVMKNEEFFNNNNQDILKDRLTVKSENVNLSSLILSSPQYSNASSNYKICNKSNIGHIIKRNDKNNLRKDLFHSNITYLNLNDIQRIKQKLESLNYFNLNS